MDSNDPQIRDLAAQFMAEHDDERELVRWLESLQLTIEPMRISPAVRQALRVLKRTKPITKEINK